MLTQLSPRELRAMKLDRLRLGAWRAWCNIWPILAMLAMSATTWWAGWWILSRLAQ